MTKNDLETLWLNADNWKFFYTIYYCKSDPRLIVPKINCKGVPIKWLGATFNFAHFFAYILLIFITILSFIPVIFVWTITTLFWLALLSLFVTIYIIFEVIWYFATKDLIKKR